VRINQPINRPMNPYWLLLVVMLFVVGCGTVQPIETLIPPTQTTVLDPTPAAPPSGNAGGGGATGVNQPLIDQALAEVSATTGIPLEELEIVTTEAVEWPSSALGCPMPGQMYLDVITPGFRIEVRAGDELFDVGTNLDGSAFVVCPRNN
jgi:hypothetical protein